MAEPEDGEAEFGKIFVNVPSKITNRQDPESGVMGFVTVVSHATTDSAKKRRLLPRASAQLTNPTPLKIPGKHAIFNHVGHRVE
jgi:hypothetical protein